MRVILEGIDGTGKSTLLKQLIHTELGKPPRSATPSTWTDYFREKYTTEQALSRCHVSERVYGRLIRGRSLISDENHWHLTMQLRALDYRIFYLNVPYEDVRRRILSRPDPTDYDLWVLDHYEEMRAAYNAELPKDMVTFLDNHDGATHTLPTPKPSPKRRGIGWITPKVFIVGEEFTVKRWNFQYARPFDAGESSVMVYDAFHGLPDIYITNALYPDLGAVRSQANLQYEYQGGNVIAIGSIARDACHRAGIPVDAYFAHPQYWRRFKYHDREQWAKEIRTVTEGFLWTSAS